jgi:Flp pilus assembly protein TadG
MRRTKNFFTNNLGASAIEFAFIVPLLLLLAVGTIEVSRNVQFHQKLDSSSAQMVNIINQNLNLSQGSARAIMSAGLQMMKPFNSSKMAIFITAIEQNDASGQPSDLVWQVSQVPDADKVTIKSKIAPIDNGKKVMLNFITLSQNDQIIVVEIMAPYTPMIDNAFTRKMLGLSSDGDDKYEYKYAIGRPRFGAFQFDPNCVVGNKVKLNCGN